MTSIYYQQRYIIRAIELFFFYLLKTKITKRAFFHLYKLAYKENNKVVSVDRQVKRSKELAKTRCVYFPLTFSSHATFILWEIIFRIIFGNYLLDDKWDCHYVLLHSTLRRLFTKKCFEFCNERCLPANDYTAGTFQHWTRTWCILVWNAGQIVKKTNSQHRLRKCKRGIAVRHPEVLHL